MISKRRLKITNKHEAIIIFTRFPIPGQAKTRLIPHLGADKAADLQRLMTEYTLEQANEVYNRRNAVIEVHYEGGSRELVANWLRKGDIAFCRQQEGSLGVKMIHALFRGFNVGYKKIIIIGTDCLSLKASILEEAFDALDKVDLALGPAKDGGFYLIGLKKAEPTLFKNVKWGTEKVLRSTIVNAEKLHLSIYSLPTLSDIDRPEDLVCLSEPGRALINKVNGISD